MIIINLINSSSSFRSSEGTWTPLCLPLYSPDVSLFLYTCHVFAHISVCPCAMPMLQVLQVLLLYHGHTLLSTHAHTCIHQNAQACTHYTQHICTYTYMRIHARTVHRVHLFHSARCMCAWQIRSVCTVRVCPSMAHKCSICRIRTESSFVHALFSAPFHMMVVMYPISSCMYVPLPHAGAHLRETSDSDHDSEMTLQANVFAYISFLTKYGAPDVCVVLITSKDDEFFNRESPSIVRKIVFFSFPFLFV